MLQKQGRIENIQLRVDSKESTSAFAKRGQAVLD